MKTRTIVAALLLLGLSACGKRDALRPPDGHNLPPQPATASFQPTVDHLLEPKGDIPYGVAICVGALMAFPSSLLLTTFAAG